MPYKVAAFYQFAALPDFRALREPLYAQLCALIGLIGLHAALALWADHAWRRREDNHVESA